MVLKLYFDFLSQPSRTLYIFFKKCNIPFEEHTVEILKGENLDDEYRKIFPLGKLPAIEHDGFKLAESVGIVRYVSREFKIADHWYPKLSKNQAKVDEYLEWQHLNTRVFCARYSLAAAFFPMVRQKAPRPEKIKKLENDMVNCLNEFENKWLMDKAFITGDKISIADIYAACEIEQTRTAGYDPRNGRPKLASWFDRVAHETAPYYSMAHARIDEFIRKIGDKPPHSYSIDEIFY